MGGKVETTWVCDLCGHLEKKEGTDPPRIWGEVTVDISWATFTPWARGWLCPKCIGYEGENEKRPFAFYPNLSREGGIVARIFDKFRKKKC